MEKSAFTYNEIIWTFFIISFIYLWTFFITNSLCSRLCILTQNYTNSLKLYKLYSGSLPTFGLRKKKKKPRRIIGMPNHENRVHMESIFCGCFVLFLSCILYKLIYFKTWRYVGRWIIHLLKKNENNCYRYLGCWISLRKFWCIVCLLIILNNCLFTFFNYFFVTIKFIIS